MRALPDPHSPLRELLNLALPMVVSQGSFAAMVFADRLFMSFIGPGHMAAAMGGGIASFLSLSLFLGVMSYANALVAQYYGAGAMHKCPRVVTAGLLMAILFLPFIAVVAYFVYQLFAAMGHQSEVVALEQTYYRILLYGCFFNLSKACIASYFAGIGRTRVIMIADVFGMLINIPLSYALVFGALGLPALGIAGAAWGTVISTVFALAVFLGFYLSRDHRLQFRVRESLRIDWGILRRYARLGFPSGFEMFMNIATFNLFILMFQAYGVAAGAAAAIVFNWDMVSFVPMIGLNIAVISLIGRYVGARDMSKANAVIAAGFKLALSYAACLGLLFIVLRQPMIGIFASSGADFSEIRRLGGFMMVGLACYVLADAALLIAGGVLRGAGDTRWLMITSISLHWAMVVAQYYVILVLQLSAETSWRIFVASILLLALIYLWRLYGGVWRQPERLDRVMQE
jgi:MATE family multidrug resistance protein